MAALRRDDRGVAMTEFALVLPLLLLVGLVGAEVANFAIANLRVSQIAMTTADNAGRVRDAISEYDVNELFIGAKLMGEGIKFAEHGRIILSSIEPRTDAPKTTSVNTGSGTVEMPNQWIRWQRCYGMKQSSSSYGMPRNAAGTAITDGKEVDGSTTKTDQVKSVPTNGASNTPTGMGPPSNQIGAGSGTAVMFVEVVYDYQPIIATSFLGNRTIRYTSAFNVRQRNDQVMKLAGLDTNKRPTCNRFYS